MFLTAYAQDAGAAVAGAPSAFTSFLPIILIFAVFYFFLIRPQARRAREHQEMLKNLRRGDRVVTQGGLYGFVEKLDDETVSLKIADGVVIDVTKQSVSQVAEKGVPATQTAPAKKPAAKPAAKKVAAKKATAKKAAPKTTKAKK